MADIIRVHVEQVGLTNSLGAVRGHTVPIDRPTAKGGTDQGVMGGELILMAVGGCFMSNLLAAVNVREANVSNVRITVEGTLESAPPRYTAIVMRVEADYDDRETMEKLVTIAERGCINTNTLKKAVNLTVEVGERSPAAT